MFSSVNLSKCPVEDVLRPTEAATPATRRLIREFMISFSTLGSSFDWKIMIMNPFSRAISVIIEMILEKK